MRFLAATILSLSAMTAYAFEGSYDVSGNDPYEKTEYSGSATIKKDKNNVYQAKWDITESGKQYKYTGTGLPIDDDTIAFSYKNTSGPSEQGLTIYTRKDDQTLEGPFVIIDKNLVGKEALTLAK